MAALMMVMLRSWTELEFESHERQIAVELCRSVALCDLLRRELEILGPVVAGQHGPKVNPLIADLRQQRLVVARLTAALNIPARDGQGAPRRPNAPRGVYLKGAK